MYETYFYVKKKNCIHHLSLNFFVGKKENLDIYLSVSLEWI